MSYTMEQIRELRERTGSGVLDCKKALEATGGDIGKAIEYLRKKGIAQAEKKLERKMAAGVVDAYIHPGERLGVLVQVECETDFVARNQEFRQFVHDIAMQIAAYDPMAVARDDLPAEVVTREREIYESQLGDTKKPQAVIEKIVAGKLEKFYSEACLLEQPFVKNPDKRVGDYVKEQIAKFGENIRIARFARYKLGA
ncbi:MAG: translation elongation factor Ts [candidate division WOR-3 bacterium]